MNLIEQAFDFEREHGHFGLIRDGEKEFKASAMLMLSDDELPPVDVAALPESMKIASWMQVENQLSQGSCQGHARTSANELGIYRETQGTILQLNRQFAYITSQIIDGINGDSGSTMSGGANASKKWGDCLEELWPYTGNYNRNIPQACYDDAENRKLRFWKTLTSYDEVLRWLVHGLGGVVIGIGWNAASTPDSQGRVTRYQRGGGGHALALLDWNKQHLHNGNPYIVRFNSWGKQWGVNGVDYVHPDVIDQWCDKETVIGYSDMDGDSITPRPFDFSMI